jgi:hypothetical protein
VPESLDGIDQPNSHSEELPAISGSFKSLHQSAETASTGRCPHGEDLGPGLHHLFAPRQELGIIVSRAHGVSFGMGDTAIFGCIMAGGWGMYPQKYPQNLWILRDQNGLPWTR